ncbi:MAG: peptidylprolyl isomerase [Anaerolineae bacterium]|nr:peptidylprolyl isomerase [Anaerolineae bacterium]
MKIKYILLLALIMLAAAACDAPPLATPTPEGYMAPAAPAPAATAAAPGAVAAAPGGVEVAWAQIKPLDGALATVNDQPVTWADYEPELFRALHAVTQQYVVDWNQADNVALLPQFQDSVLQGVVDRTLLRQLAVQEGIAVTDADLQARIEADKADIMASGYFSSFVQYQQDYGLTDEYFSRLVEDELIIEQLTDKQDVARQEEQVHARHILVTTEEEGKALLARLAAGEDWAALASELSIDTGSKDNAGDLGWFGRGVMVEAFEAAAFALEVGETSDLVQSDYGYHVIQVLEKGMKDLDDYTYATKQSEAFQAWFDGQKAKASITIAVQFASQ